MELGESAAVPSGANKPLIPGLWPHGISIVAVCLLAILLTFLPYFPGEYDHLAMMLSAVVQIAGFVSLPLVPIGVSWLLYERARRKKGETTPSKSARFAIAALVALCLVVIASSVSAWDGIGSFRGSLTLGIALPAVFAYIVFLKIIARIRRTKDSAAQRIRFVPLYLAIVPAVVIAVRCACIAPAESYSINRAIGRSAALIRDLEAYYAEHGRYPGSLQGLWKDYQTGCMGVERFVYEPSGEAYHLFFEQFSPDLTAREIVMYNKLDEHVIRSHPSFVSRVSPEEFEAYRGYFAEFDLPQPH